MTTKTLFAATLLAVGSLVPAVPASAGHPHHRPVWYPPLRYAPVYRPYVFYRPFHVYPHVHLGWYAAPWHRWYRPYWGYAYVPRWPRVVAYYAPSCVCCRYVDPCYDPRAVYHSTGVGQVEYRLPAVVAPVEVLNDRPAGRRSFEVNRHAVAAAPVRERPGLEVRQKASPTVPGGSTPTSNLLARARARKFISFGDELFRKQRFHEALQQYQTAATAAPDWAEPYFRQGHALVATHRLDPAADAFKRALALHPDRDRNGFRLNEVYGDNLMAKTAHAETLAAQALARPHDADTFFLLGLFLFYDDQAPRAEKFFARAHTLAGGRDAHLRPFLLENRPAPILLAGHAGT